MFCQSMALFVFCLTLLTISNFDGTAGIVCEGDWMDCGNGKCISNLWRCDGDNDCINMKDEENCEKGHPEEKCLSSQFECASDHHCIPESWHCDGEHDCVDHSDEKNCENTECMGYRCKDHHCIPSKWRCDGGKDCPDGSDEDLCPKEKLCSADQFTCASGACVAISKLCDGKKDCSDGSDEGLHCSDTCANKTCGQACRNTPIGPECYCNSGYQLGKDNETCKDVNECLDDGFCSQQCINLPGSYKCSCMEGYELKNRNCFAAGSEPLLVFSTEKEIRGMYLRSGRYFPIQRAITKSAAVDADPDESRIYWIEMSNTSAIYSAKIDGTGLKPILNTGLLIPEDIAVDYVGRNLYITDSGLMQVLVCKLDGTMCHVLHSANTEKPRAMALDVAEGLLYWSDWGAKTAGIYRSGMDGSRRISLVSKNIKWPNGIAVDHTTNRLYWSDAQLHTIEFITLDGTTRKMVLKDIVYHPFSLAVFEDNLYWTDWSTYSLDSCNKFTGHKVSLVARENGQHIMGVHVYHPVLYQKIANPCWSHTCSHMCVLAPLGTYKCVCPPGFVLAENEQTCLLDDRYPQIFVSEGSHIFHLHPGSVGSAAITELPVTGFSNIGSIAYDWNSKQLFVSDLDYQKIYALNVSSRDRRELVTKHVTEPKDLAYDWNGNNLYWVDSIKNTVEVLSLATHHRATVISDLRRPVAITLSPKEGLMFIAAIQETHPVSQYDMDGRNRVVLRKIKGHPVSLALHPSKSELYWVDLPASTIASLEYKKRNGDVSVRKNASGVTSVAPAPNFMYWTVMKKHEVYMAKRVEMFHTLVLPGSHKDSSLKRVIYARSITRESSKCANNGGCSHICLVKPSGKSCFCPDGFLLQKDSMTCVEKRECTKTEFKCVGSQKCISHQLYCDGTVDCEDGSDELCKESMQRCPSTDFQCRNGRCIIQSWKCDHRNDCGDNSDEENCPKKSDCDADQFTCTNGECIPKLWRCDKQPDCGDQSDEHLCNETVCDAMQLRCDHGQCIPTSWMCDGVEDCHDGIDERNCSKKKVCKPDEFKCVNGLCIDKKMVCDKRNDCGDGSDEANCTASEPEPCTEGHFRCKDGLCIYDHEICDGHLDCKDHEDEANCSYTECDGEEFFCSSTKRCLSRRWVCDGTDDCGDGSDENVNECASQVHTTTLPPKKVCDDFTCDSGDCIPWFKVCNDEPDCPDKSDEGVLCKKSCPGNNAGCSQLCRHTPHGSQCSCNSGYRLLPDGRTCDDVDECRIPGHCSQFCNNTRGGYKCSCAPGYFLEQHQKCKADGGPSTLIFLLPDQIRGIDLHTGTFRIYFSIGERSDIRGMDYDAEESVFFFTEYEKGTVNSHNLDTNSSDIIAETERVQFVKWDWIAKNLYYTDLNTIYACTRNGKHSTEVIKDAAPQFGSFDIDPVSGFMFWSVWALAIEKNSGIIERADMDGSNRITILSEKLRWPNAITIDRVMKMIYWTDTRLNVMECADFHGFNRKHVVMDNMYYPYAMAKFEDNVYWSDWGTDKIIVCDKFTGTDCDDLHKGDVKSEVMTVVHRVNQPKVENRCENSGCDQICLLSQSSFTCKCGMGFELEGKSCVPRHRTSSESPVVPKSDSPVIAKSQSCPELYCGEGGKCIIENNTYVCQCQHPFQGERCETKVASLGSGHDSRWIVAVLLSFMVLGILIVVTVFCRRNRDKLNKLGESVAVSFRNPHFGRRSGRLIVDSDDTGAYDELMLSKQSEETTKQTGFGNPLFGKKIVKEPDVQDGDFKRWPSYDSEDSAFVSESQPRDEGSQLCIDEMTLGKVKTTDRIVQFFRKL